LSLRKETQIDKLLFNP